MQVTVKPNEFDYRKLKAVGSDVYIAKNVAIKRPELVTIGSHVAIDDGFYLTTNALIGDYIHIAPYNVIIGGKDANITLEDFTTLAAGGRFICGTDGYRGAGLQGPVPPQYRDEVIIDPITIKRFTNVGVNAVIMPGVTLAEGTVIGASSLVTRDTEPWSIYAGTPARKIGERDGSTMKQYAKELGYA